MDKSRILFCTLIILSIVSSRIFVNEIYAKKIKLTVSASSVEKSETEVLKCIDGDLNTRWSSVFEDNQWLLIDFGKQVTIKNLDIYWEAAYTKEYEILISKDKTKWKKVYAEQNGDGGLDEIIFFKHKVRYVKINCIKRGTEWGNSIYEIVINGVHDINHALPDPDQRRHDYLIREEPLVLEWLKQMQDMGTPDKQLVPSMECKQLQTFNNSLVAMAFMLKGERKRAERILDFYKNAAKKTNKIQDLQNFYYNGEARGFYQSAIYETRKGITGYFAMGKVDRWMGDMVWLLFAYKYYEKRYKSNRYNKIVKTIKELVISWFKEEGDGGYVRHGWRKGDVKLHEAHGHHEGNIDAYALFKLCGDDLYAKKIRKWLDKNIQGTDLPLDLYTWRVLAYGKKYAYLLNIPDTDTRFRKTINVNNQMVTGFYHCPNAEMNNIWLDGTGHIACAYITCGDKKRGYFYANQLDACLIKRNIKGKVTYALPFTANRTGDYKWVDTSKGFVSVAAWYIFAKNQFNPFRIERIREKPPLKKNPYRNKTKVIGKSIKKVNFSGKGKILDDFNNLDNWSCVGDNETPLSLVKGGNNEGIFGYSFEKGVWVSFKKQGNIPPEIKTSTIVFELKTDGPSNNFELKLIDNDDSVFMWKIDGITQKDYKKFVLKPSDFQYGWGGDKNLGDIKIIEVTISKTEGGNGRMFVRNFMILK